MSSLIVSNNLHLMMLEIAVENLFVPWISEFDKVILKKTTVKFRMLDEEWTPLSPNRHDCLPYQGSNYENEKFYGGRSVVFCVPADFFEKEASGIDVQLYVEKEVCKYFQMNSRQDVGFVSVPVDELLNGISRQIRERNELAEYLSDFYKRQIISRSMTGTYTLRSEDLQDTAATISLYIRISCLGRSVVTEIASIEEPRGLYRVRGESDEKDPYLTRKLTARNLREGSCWGDLPAIPRGRLVCRCEELDAEEVTDLSDRVDYIKKDGIINGPPTPTRRKPPRRLISKMPVAADAAQDAAAIARTTAVAAKGAPAITPDVDTFVTDAMVQDVPADVAAKVDMVDTDATMTKIAANIIALRKEEAVKYNALRDRTIADAKQPVPSPMIKQKVKNARDKYVKASAAARAEERGRAIKDKAAFKKTVAASSKSKPGRYTATIGIVEREKRTYRPSPFPSSCQQTYPLYCRLQPRPTCFTPCLSVVPCYCRWTACSPQYIYT